MKTLGRKTLEDVCAERGLSVADILSDSRDRTLVNARTEIAKRLRIGGYSLLKISRVLRKDHTTCLHYIRREEKPVTPRFQRPKKPPKIKLVPRLEPISRPPKPVHKSIKPKYLIPYVGAGSDYVWKRRSDG